MNQRTSMTSRQRIIAALRGEPVDRLPWSPFLAYWWEAQPREFQARGQLWFNREIGSDFLWRGPVVPFKTITPPDCEEIMERKDGQTCTRRVTPVGTLTTLSRYSPQGNTEFVIEHPVKTVEDLKILSYYFERVRYEPDYGPVQAEIERLGEDGLVVPLISPLGKTPFQALLEHYVGTQQLNYLLADAREEVEALLDVLSERCLEAVRIAAGSPAEVFITWEDSSTTMVSPRQFKRYIASQMDRWGEVVQGAGKMLLHHACGKLRALLPIMAGELVDMIESLPPPPTGDVEVWEAQAVLGERVGIIGGIEPVRFLEMDLDELTCYVEELLSGINPHHYILANSDSCPPGVSIEKFRRVTEIVRSFRV